MDIKITEKCKFLIETMYKILIKLKTNHELIISLMAILISCMAIMQTSISLKMQREHNYKSVKPIAEISVKKYENLIAVTLQNKGVGPLIIKKLKVYKSGKKNIIKENIIDWLPSNPKNLYWSDFFIYTKGISILPGETKNLIELKGELNNKIYLDYREQIKSILKDLTIELEYVDIYDNYMPLKRIILSSFGN